MTKKEIYTQILTELVKIKEWATNPKTQQENFDIAELYFSLKKHNDTLMELPFINEIYSLTDVLVDSLRHEMKLINKNYTVEEGLYDLDKIINTLKAGDYSELEEDTDLLSRLNSKNLYK